MGRSRPGKLRKFKFMLWFLAQQHEAAYQLLKRYEVYTAIATLKSFGCNTVYYWKILQTFRRNLMGLEVTQRGYSYFFLVLSLVFVFHSARLSSY
jgi:hypothetical protein